MLEPDDKARTVVWGFPLQINIWAVVKGDNSIQLSGEDHERFDHIGARSLECVSAELQNTQWSSI